MNNGPGNRLLSSGRIQTFPGELQVKFHCCGTDAQFPGDILHPQTRREQLQTLGLSPAEDSATGLMHCLNIYAGKTPQPFVKVQTHNA